jgi:6-pyruvoyl-tetrahydropterin synthase
MKVARRYFFDASHSLPGIEGYDHEHGHRYTVEVAVGPSMDEETGMVVDTALLDGIYEPLCESLQDTNLNESVGIFTTVENLADWFRRKVYAEINNGCSVTVWEDDDRWGQAP